MEEDTVEVVQQAPINNSLVVREVKVYYKKDFSGRYCIEFNGDFYEPSLQGGLKNRGKKPREGMHEDYSENVVFNFSIALDQDVNLVLLQKVAEDRIQTLKQEALKQKAADEKKVEVKKESVCVKVAHGKENAFPRLHALIKLYSETINAEHVKAKTGFQLVGDSLVRKEDGIKIELSDDGGMKSQVFGVTTEEDELAKKLFDVLMAEILTYKVLHKETEGKFPSVLGDISLEKRGDFSDKNVQGKVDRINAKVEALLANTLDEETKKLFTYDGRQFGEKKRKAGITSRLAPAEKKKKPTRALFCIDFDKTISSKHTHNIINNGGADDEQEQWDLVKDIPPIGEAKEWKKLFKTLHEDGHNIAIVSFNQYAHIIRRYLKEVIGLDKNFLREYVNVESFIPEDQSNKKEHIQRANAKLNTPAEDIVLVDDTKSNIDHAVAEKHRVITASADGKHINEMLRLSKKIKNPDQKDNDSVTHSGASEGNEYGRRISH